MDFDLILTKVRAALIGFLLPATALIVPVTIRPAIFLSCNTHYEFILNLLFVDAQA